ncbi:MAG TPA: TlpA disulfide reductase family protein [Gaiellaceae bacterium]|jgi:cytochrome c biogenesis protein CcmG/thiol:disulfide interchange protein DsbE|nr:TlpA disulfide reductase family protein [Gaiellaceae bacterium]
MRVVRAAAAAAVLALLGLLVWDVSHSGHGGVAAKVDKGHTVVAPTTALPFFGTRNGTFDLAAYRGKVVVLNFWASWCVDCKLEARTLHDAAAKWGSNVVFVGVDGSDLTGAAAKYMKHYDVNYSVVRDIGGHAQSTWGVTGFPETFFVDPQGRVIPPHIVGPVTATRLKTAIRQALAA